MGRDWFVQDMAGTRVIWHAGNTLGQHTDFFAIPEQGVVLIELTNGEGDGSAAGRGALDGLDATLSQFPVLAPLTGKIGRLSALIAPPDAPTVTVPAEELAEYAGHYADPTQVMTFTTKGEELEGSTEMIDHPGVYQPAILPPQHHRRR